MSARKDQITRGMAVFTADNQQLGSVDEARGDGFVMGGRAIPQSAVNRVTREEVYLRGGAAEYAGSEGEGEIRVPVAEEQLRVGTREVELGAVEINRRVVEEERSVPVTLRREEVNVREVDTPDRPLRAGEDVFSEETIRVAVRGEEAVVAKEAVVTG